MTWPFLTMTQPTMGLGSTRPRPLIASRIARCMCASSLCMVVDRLGAFDRWRLEKAVEKHQANADAQHRVGDVEDPGEKSGPHRQGVDHVTDIAVDNPVVQVAA